VKNREQFIASAGAGEKKKQEQTSSLPGQKNPELHERLVMNTIE